jgi:hypothetical protein
MRPSLAGSTEVNAPVWVWDGHWLPAVVVSPGPTREFLIVRFGHGVSAPLPSANMRIRRPSLRGADIPSDIDPLVADLVRTHGRLRVEPNVVPIANASTPELLDGVSSSGGRRRRRRMCEGKRASRLP